MSRRNLTLAAVLLLIIAPLVLPEFYVTLLNYTGLASIVALGLVLLTGVAGQMSFGQAAFVGIGAYTTAVLTTRYDMSPWLGLPAAIALTAVIALFLGFITLRLSGHYLPLGTIAWGIAIYFLLGNLEWLGKYSGIAEIPPLTLLGVRFGDGRTFYYLIWAVTLLALLAARNLLDSRSGRAIRALKARTIMAESFGVDTARLKIVVFVYAAVLASLSGWLYAHFLRFISPQPFGVNASIDYLFMAVIGGSTEVWGAVTGAALLTFLREWIRDLLPKVMEQSGNFEIVVFGAHRRGHAAPDPRWACILCRPSDPPRHEAHVAGNGRAAPDTRPATLRGAAARASRRKQVVRRVGGGKGAVIRNARWRDSRVDRPERCRQEHGVQSDDRCPACGGRADRVSRRAHRASHWPRDRAPRRCPDFSARQHPSRP